VPGSLFTYYCKHIILSAIAEFQQVRIRLLEEGPDEIEANLCAADQVVAKSKDKMRVAGR
jgi:hypothetical protein